MIVLNALKETEEWVAKVKSKGKIIGFVPTMGALHDGHMSLVERAEKENDMTIVSIFVNPTQFNNPDDLKKYPRTEEADIELLKKAAVDAVFIPDEKSLYPNGQQSEHFDFNGIENQMEGKFRPGHFDGVGTIVKKLFEIIQPDRVYFGEKDFQQLRIIQQMVASLKLPIQIVPVPIKRESDGLAMSSRNARLTKEMRKEAPIIYKILKEARKYYQNHSVSETKKWVQHRIEQTGLKLEYFEIADENTLLPVVRKTPSRAVRGFLAVFAGEIRLIDNIRLN